MHVAREARHKASIHSSGSPHRMKNRQTVSTVIHSMYIQNIYYRRHTPSIPTSVAFTCWTAPVWNIGLFPGKVPRGPSMDEKSALPILSCDAQTASVDRRGEIETTPDVHRGPRYRVRHLPLVRDDPGVANGERLGGGTTHRRIRSRNLSPWTALRRFPLLKLYSRPCRSCRPWGGTSR